MTRDDIRKILIPTLGQTVASVLISIIILVIIYRELILNKIFGDSAELINFARDSYTARLATLNNNVILNKLAIGLFWSVLGLVAYTLLWAAFNVIIEARNEVVVGTEFTNKARFAQRVKAPLTQISLAALLFIFLGVTGKLLLPLWLDLFHTGVLTIPNWHGLITTIAAVIGLAANFYLVAIFIQLVFKVD